MATAMATPTERIDEPDGRTSELFDLPHDEATLLRLFRVLFEEHPREITFGPCIQGAVYEIHAEVAPKLTMMDGYLTVDFGPWHFHLCIGPHKGCPPALAKHRQVKRAALFRTWGKSCVPASWGLRLWNGQDEQMITVFLPNPYLDENDHRLREPNWDRLHLWDKVRHDFLGLEPDPSDRRKGQE